MFTSRILAAVALPLLLIVWISSDQLPLDDIPRTAGIIAARVNRTVIRETSAFIKKIGFTEAPAETVVAAPASPQPKRTRGPIRPIAPASDATDQPTSGELTVAPPGNGPADIDDSSDPIVVASEGGVIEDTAGEEGNEVDE